MSGGETRPAAVVHVDLDGAKHIFRSHGWPYEVADDPLFESGLEGALDVFARANVGATLFVIAEDLQDARKRRLIDAAVKAGHEIASHSITHRHLTKLDRAEKTREIVESRQAIVAALGVSVLGFRAPGFQADRECLELIAGAGYAYDSSVFAGQPSVGASAGPAARGQAHVEVPVRGHLELPVPARATFGLPFHPSYSLVAGDWYFRAGLSDLKAGADPFVLLFHLTDFSEPLAAPRIAGWRQRLFTLSHLGGASKRRRSAGMLNLVAERFSIVSTSDWLRTRGSLPQAAQAGPGVRT